MQMILKSSVQQTDSLSSLQNHPFYLFIGTFLATSLVLLILENGSHKKSPPSGEARFFLHKSSIYLLLYKIRVSLCV